MAGANAPELARAAVEAGVDTLEIGFPFSDPLAEGPVIREAAESALAAGMRTSECLECLAAVRAAVPHTALIPMTYAALLEAYGYERFVLDALDAGANSFILVDVPMDEQTTLKRVQLIAPTTSDQRIATAGELTDGWLYVVSVIGTTGIRRHVSPDLGVLAERARRLAKDVPLYAGFGIATPEQAREAGTLVDGVIIGTRAVEVAREGPQALYSYVRTIREAIDTHP